MDYASLVHRVRELVWEHVPVGSNVAVVSKGDPALILFDQRNGWHYPQTESGHYLGHHPDSGAAAVAHLESLRQRGAEYLVIPGTYAWFLDYYTDLRNHLHREGEVVHRDEVCAIHSLVKRELTSPPTNTASERQLRDLVSAVLPRGSKVVAFSWSHAALAGAGDFQVLQSPAVDVGDHPDFSGLDAGVRVTGAQYVVVPAPPPGQTTDGNQQLFAHCRATWTTLLDQRHVCAVFATSGQKVVR